MSTPRKPAAFRIEEPVARKVADKPAKKRVARAKTVNDKLALTIDDSLETELVALEPIHEPVSRRGGWRFGTIFLGATGVLLSLAFGVWVEDLISSFFQRSDWLGWLAAALAGIAVFALAGLVLRETAAIFRLKSVAKLRTKAADVAGRGDIAGARRLLGDLEAFTRHNASTARGREALAALEDEIIDAEDLIAIAERELFAHLDRQAKDMILQSAKRVSVVTAVSPRALIDVGYVLYESGRLIRRISVLYGGRPGGLGFIKLVRDVAAHLAVTGSIAVGDSLVQQVIGHGLAAKLSARLGEGVVNGLMTVRIGIAAMDTARPLPFIAEKRPGMGDFLGALTTLGTAKDRPD